MFKLQYRAEYITPEEARYNSFKPMVSGAADKASDRLSEQTRMQICYYAHTCYVLSLSIPLLYMYKQSASKISDFKLEKQKNNSGAPSIIP